MNEQISTLRTPETLGAEIRKLTETAKYMTLWYAVEIGRRLTEAKALVQHGEWMDFLAKETEFSSSSANRFMTAFREYGGGEKLNFPTLGNISVSNALRLLAVPEEERETFAAEVDAEHISARELEQAIRERDEAKKLAEESERLRAEMADEYAGARTELETAKRKITELEHRPVDVAVQEPDLAEIKRRVREATEAARADKEAAERLLAEEKEKAKAAADELRKKLKAAEEKLAGAGAEDRAEAEKLRGEVETLKKQIAMSDEATVTFKLRFMEWQEAFRAAVVALHRLPEESREKCRGAVLAQLENWKEAL